MERELDFEDSGSDFRFSDPILSIVNDIELDINENQMA